VEKKEFHSVMVGLVVSVLVYIRKIIEENYSETRLNEYFRQNATLRSDLGHSNASSYSLRYDSNI